MPDLPEEVSHLADQFGNLSRLIPTNDIRDFEQSINSLGIALGKSNEELGDIQDTLKGLRGTSNLAKNDFIALADGFYRSSNRLTISLKDYTAIASQVSKVDPFNASQRTRELERYAPLLSRLTGNLKDNKDAYRLLAIAEGEHNYAAANTIRAMINGEKASDSYALSIKKLGNVYKDASLDAASFISQSTVLKGALSLLSSDTGSSLIKIASAFLAATAAKRGFFAITGFGGGGHGGGGGLGGGMGGSAGSQAASLAAMAGTRTTFGKFRRGAAIGAGIAGAGALLGSNDENRGGVVGGAVSGAGIGALFGPETAVIGAGIGAVVGWFSKVPDSAKKAEVAAKRATETFEGMAGAASGRIELINKLFTGDTSEGVRRSMLAARSEIAQTAASMGLVGPQIISKIAEESIDSYKKQYAIMKEEKDRFIQDMVGKGDSLVVANQKYGIELINIQNNILRSAGVVRRSILEQFTASSINAPSGSYSMPGGLSDRQKYGGSYYDFMPLTNISNRPKQQRYEDMAAKFAPILNQIAGSINGGGKAGGGLIPGAPSASDNRISAVASGEYVVNASAVSHYGAGLFESLNSKRSPRFAGGGLFGGVLSGVGGGFSATGVFDSIASGLSNLGDKIADRLSAGSRSRAPDESIGDFMSLVSSLGGTKTQGHLVKYAQALQLQSQANTHRYTSDVMGDHLIPGAMSNQAAVAIAKKEILQKEQAFAAISPSESRLSGVLPAQAPLKEWAGIRARGSSYHPNFGKSPFADVMLGGHGPSKHHRDYFSESVFNHEAGSPHVGGHHNGNHRNESNTPELKKLDEINKNIISLKDATLQAAKGYIGASTS